MESGGVARVNPGSYKAALAEYVSLDSSIASIDIMLPCAVFTGIGTSSSPGPAGSDGRG